MGGDLNLKKSFHPALMRNQIRVAEEEKKALDERKKTDQRLRELKEERAREEIERKLEESGSRVNRIDRNLTWMYESKQEGAAGTTEELEGFLLGKRRIDGILTRGGEQEKLDRGSGLGIPGAGAANVEMVAPVVNARDMAAKVRDDPLLAIKKQEQALYEAVMNDPIKRRQLLATMGIDDSQERERSKRNGERSHRHRHHHRHHSHGHRRDSRERRSDDEIRSSRRRRTDSRDRSGSPRRSDNEGDRKRRRRYSDDRERDDDYHRRERRDRDRRRDTERSDSRERTRRDYSRSRSPPRRRDNDSRRDSYRQEPNGKPLDRREARDSVPRSQQNSYSNDHGSGGSKSNGYGNGFRAQQPTGNKQSDEEERARKLAAMQSAASDLDVDRERRLAAIEAADQSAQQADNQAREKASRYGDRAFVSGLHRQAGERKLADRVGGRGQGDRDD